MPMKSEKQRRAMHAAKAGRSTIGIPRSVGKEYVASDTGGKLPKAAPKKGTSIQKMFRKGRRKS